MHCNREKTNKKQKEMEGVCNKCYDICILENCSKYFKQKELLQEIRPK